MYLTRTAKSDSIVPVGLIGIAGNRQGLLLETGMNGGVQVATGSVKWFSDERGYGFIVPDEGGKEVFVHRSNIESESRSLLEGQKVEFEIGEGRKGPEATNVRPISSDSDSE